MLFLGDQCPVRQDADINKQTKHVLDHLLELYKDIMPTSINNIWHTKLMKMGIVTDPNFPFVTSTPYILPLKHHNFVYKEIEDSEKAGIFQRNLLLYFEL